MRCPTCQAESPGLCRHSRFLCQHQHEEGCCPDAYHFEERHPMGCICPDHYDEPYNEQ